MGVVVVVVVVVFVSVVVVGVVGVASVVGVVWYVRVVLPSIGVLALLVRCNSLVTGLGSSFVPGRSSIAVYNNTIIG